MITGQEHSTINVRPYNAENIPAILELLKSTVGEAPSRRKTGDFWRWKHHANPFGESYGLCAANGSPDEVVAVRALMRWQFRSPGGQSIMAARAVDTATHPRLQRQGIFSTLTRQAREDLQRQGVHFIFNTPNPRSLQGYLKLGWRVVETWPLFVKVLRPVRMLLSPVRRTTAAGAQTIRFEQYFRGDVLPFAHFARRYEDQLPSFIADWEASRTHTGLRTPRDLAYLEWRYGRHPHVDYGVYALEGGRGLDGFAVLRPNLRYGLKEIVITELFLRQPAPEVGRTLLRSLANAATGDYLIAHFAAKSVERETLRRGGFLKAPRQGIVFTACILNALDQDLFQPDAWDLSLGDLEIF